jgi:hypothetical protein
MKKKKHKKTHDTTNRKKKDLAYYQENFSVTCDFCGQPLEVIKHRPKTDKKVEVVSATCTNDNYKELGCKCELYLIEIRFRCVSWC